MLLALIEAAQLMGLLDAARQTVVAEDLSRCRFRLTPIGPESAALVVLVDQPAVTVDASMSVATGPRRGFAPCSAIVSSTAARSYDM